MTDQYKICKQLKDAGFLTRDCSFILYENGEIRFTLPNGDIVNPTGEAGYVELPTLDELMEECGEGIDVLERSRGGWHTDNGEMDNEKYIETVAKTRWEAVAKLYLKLNA